MKNTQWHNIIAWGKKCRTHGQVPRKGSKVAVTGMLNYRSYEDKAGQARQITEIVVSEFMKIGDSQKGVQGSQTVLRSTVGSISFGVDPIFSSSLRQAPFDRLPSTSSGIE